MFTPELAKKDEKVHNELLTILRILDIARGDAGVEGMAQSWYYYRDEHKFSEWKNMMKNTTRSINSRRTPGKTEWEDFFQKVSYKIDHKKEKKAEF